MKLLLAVALCASPLALPMIGASSAPEQTSPVQDQLVFDTETSPELRVRAGEYGKLHVWVNLDGKLGGWFKVDTGADRNHLTMQGAKSLGMDLKYIGRVSGVGSSAKAYRGHGESLQMGPVTLNSPAFVVPDTEPNPGDDTIGVLGSDLFMQSVVVYDAFGKRMSIHDPKTYQGPPLEWQTCTLLDDRPFANLTIEGQPVLLEIDTGGGEDVLLTVPAVKRLKLEAGRDVQASEIFGPYGGVPVKRAVLRSVDVGANRFVNLPGTLAVKSKGFLGATDHDGLIGAPILNHLVVTFDYPGQRIAFTDRRLYAKLTGESKAELMPAFSSHQANGKPDAVDRSTYGNAWFPATDSGKHWLEVSFAKPIKPVTMQIWGTSGQAGLTAIQATTEAGQTVDVDWNGQVGEQAADGLAQNTSKVDVTEAVVKLRFEIDCSLMGGVNAIDAVGLVDGGGQVFWAQAAKSDGSFRHMQRLEFDPATALGIHADRLEKLGEGEAAAQVRAMQKAKASGGEEAGD